MKILVFYRPESEHGRMVDSFVHDFRRAYESIADCLQLQDIDSREGVALASLYDIVQYPGFAVLHDDGSLLKTWQGQDLPRLEEVANLVYSAT